jgi:membrane protein DedA with SNARE-associated domain
VAETLNQIVGILQNTLSGIGYPGIFFLVFIENFVGPLPMPPILPLSGMLAAQGKMSFFAVWMSAVLGALVGALALYALGTWLDERLMRSLIRRYGHYLRLTEAGLDRSLALFRQYGGAAIVICRLVPVLRNAVSLTAGMSRMPLTRFVFFTALISTPSIGLWVYGGYLLGEHWGSILAVMGRFEVLIPILISILLGAALILIVRRVRFSRRSA